jgi:PAS domain S-box-containing protein
MLRVLYVDDEPALLDLSKLFLEQGGEFLVDTTTSTSAALSCMQSTNYDAIVSDYQMPDMNGIDFLKLVRASGKSVPFILFTGRGREEVVIEAINNGADFYIQKGGAPTAQFAELAHKIRQAVSRQRAQDELRAAYMQLTATEEELRSHIEELIENQAALKKSEEKFRDIVETSPDLIWELNPEGSYTYISPSCISILGYSQEEILGKPVFSIVPDAALSQLREILSRGSHTRRRANGFDLPFRCRDGHIVVMEIRSVALFDTGGRFTGFRGTARDITEKRNAEAALNESEKKFRALIEHSLDAIVIADFSGKLLFMNQAANRLVEASDFPALIGKANLLEFVAPESRSDVQHDLGQVSQGIDAYLVNYKLITAKKREVWVECIGKKIPFGGSAAMLVSLREISDRRQAEEAVRQANRKLNLLTGITRHDIGNQLLALDGYVSLLHKKVPDPGLTSYFSRINEASSRIASMIRFTKDYEQVGVHAPLWQDLTTLVNEAGKSALPGTVTLKNDLPAGMEVFADPLIARVFYNLIDNTVRHGGEISTIRFALEAGDGRRIIVCEDDGDGVPGGIKERIFERGFGKNTGFGLFISREVLDITGITINETGVPGTGARFEIEIPDNKYRFGNPGADR